MRRPHLPSSLPHPPYPTAASVTADALGDGRFILYDANGDIWIEDAADAQTYAKVASGYTGDPGFIAVAPDGHTCLVCSGMTGLFWVFDASTLTGTALTIGSDMTNSYWGEWINDTQIIVDRSDEPVAWSFISELGLLDISNQSAPQFAVVVSNKGRRFRGTRAHG